VITNTFSNSPSSSERQPGSPPTWISRWEASGHSLDAVGSISASEMLEMAALGYSMYEQGKYENAKVIFSGLCALDPRESYYRTALGAVYMVQDELDVAEQLFNAAIALNDREMASFVNRGEIHLRKGRIAEAAADFKAAVSLDPQNRDPLSRRARLLAAAALQSLEAAHGGRSLSREMPRASEPKRTRSSSSKAVAAKPLRSSTGSQRKK
jgi:tetratricopeptide (TPR) repeat protein